MSKLLLVCSYNSPFLLNTYFHCTIDYTITRITRVTRDYQGYQDYQAAVWNKYCDSVTFGHRIKWVPDVTIVI